MDRGSARALPRRHPGARSVLGPRGGVRQRRAPPRRARANARRRRMQGINLPYNASTALPGPYILPYIRLDVRVIETNKVATMPVRGGLSGRCICDGTVARPRRRRARSSAPRCGAAAWSPGRCRTSHRSRPAARRSPSAAAAFRPASAWCSKRSTTPASPPRHARREGRYRPRRRQRREGTGRGPFESGIVRIGRSGRISVSCAMPMGQGIKRAGANLRRAVRRRAG